MKNSKIKITFVILLIITTLTSCYTNRFSYKERKIIRRNDDNEIMKLFLVTNPQDSVILYTKSKNIKANPKNKQLIKLIKRMSATVADTTDPGVGIAAPQIGINRRIILVQRFDRNEKKCSPFLNVYIKEYSKTKVPGSGSIQ